jgi:hypothetical protein
MRDPSGGLRKLIVFTEHRDTLEYLVERLRGLLGAEEAVTSIHGGTPREERRKRQALFTGEKDCVVLVATDAAGEGVNLQRAHLLVNYDLPWNPNRIEQRFGRVHRIGQREVCHMWNLVATGTREGQVFLTLLEKIEEQRKAYGGQIFDVLGQAFEGQPLADLLVRAIRYGEDPAVRAQLDEIIDSSVGLGLGALIDREALDAQVLGLADVEGIRLQMEEAQARRLQPHYISSYFLAAFAHLGGRVVSAEPGRWEVTHTPMSMRERDRVIGGRTPLLRRYERICFEKEAIRVSGKPPAELVAPAHPLLDVSIDLLLERHRALLRQGAVLIADEPASTAHRLLVMLEHEVTDGRSAGEGPRVVSKRFAFVELDRSGAAVTAGPAPYLDYRAPDADERQALAPVLAGDWPGPEAERAALSWAVAEAVPEHLAEVRDQTLARVERTRDAVKRRLRAEIDHWDHRALTLEEQVAAGKQPRMQPLRARERADALAARLARRMDELAKEAQLSAKPPVVVGAALVVPTGLLSALRGDPPTHAADTTGVERRAVDAVLRAERGFRRDPLEMAHNNKGFDIRSRTGDGHALFIEVKGRIEGAEDVTVTRNEVLHIKNAGDRGVLALVRVSQQDEEHDEVRYQYRPFDATDVSDLSVTKVVLDWGQRWAAASEPS